MNTTALILKTHEIIEKVRETSPSSTAGRQAEQAAEAAAYKVGVAVGIARFAGKGNAADMAMQVAADAFRALGIAAANVR